MHKQFEELIPFYIANTLPEAQSRALRSHLETCKTCQRALQDWLVIAGAVRHEAAVWGRPPLPPLSADVLNHARQRPIQIAPRQYAGSTPPIRRRYQAGVAIAAMITLLFVSAAYVAFRPSSGTPTPMQGAVDTSPTVPSTLVAMASPVAVRPSPTLSFPTLDPNLVTRPGPSTPSGGMPPYSPTPLPVRITPTPLPTIPQGIGVGGGGGSTETAMLPVTPTVEPAATFSPTLCNVTSATGTTVNLYREPTLASEVIGVLVPGDYLITYVWDGLGFYEVVRIGIGIVGWVPAQQVAISGSCSGLALPSPTASTPLPTAVTECILDPLSPSVPLRRGPGEQFSSYGNAAGPYTAIALSDNGWFQVVYAEDPDFTQYAWLAQEAVLVRGACGLLPVIPTAAFPTETPLP